MAELVVAGPESMQRWRRPIPEGEIIRLGRAPRSGWAVPWDGLISREHAELQFDGDQLNVRRLDAARNPIYFQEVDTSEFKLGPGDQFRIGTTIFQFVAAKICDSTSAPLEEISYRTEELKKFAFSNADHRLEVLSTLPRIMSQSATDEDLAAKIASVLLEAIPHADAAAVVHYEGDPTKAEKPTMMRWDSRTDDIGRFSPSRRLIMAALSRGQGILHVWQDSDDSDPSYTISGNLDWAFCIPVSAESCQGWSLYVSGQFGGSMNSQIVSEDDLKGDLRFTEMITEFMGAIRQVRVLEQRQAGLGQFFSPAVMEQLKVDTTGHALDPKESDISVLFCDVRGFSRKAEKAEENLHELLARVSEALGVMTCGIIKYDGVIADFQGDAALGFWGWPKSKDNDPQLACCAALDIQAAFLHAMTDEGNSLKGFKVGIGIASGRAIAGKIGTDEQIKVGAFGPVVNLGARLESMTKQLRTSILIDELTAERARESLPASMGRCRRIGKVRPAGMQKSFMISELLPPEGKGTSVTESNIVDFEAAVDAFTEGDWSKALEYLDRLPVEDRTKDFLMIYIAQNNYEAPDDWDGVMNFTTK